MKLRPEIFPLVATLAACAHKPYLEAPSRIDEELALIAQEVYACVMDTGNLSPEKPDNRRLTPSEHGKDSTLIRISADGDTETSGPQQSEGLGIFLKDTNQRDFLHFWDYRCDGNLDFLIDNKENKIYHWNQSRKPKSKRGSIQAVEARARYRDALR